MRKSLFSLMVSGLVIILCLSGSLAWAGDNQRGIPAYLQKKVLAACNQAAEQGLISPVSMVDRNTLIALVAAPCAHVRTVAVYTLGEIRCPDAAATLIVLLGDPDTNMRRVAAHALGKIGCEAAIDPLAALVDDRNQPSQVRCTAAHALGRIKGQQATNALRQVIRHNSGQVQLVAMLALHRRAMIIPADHMSAVAE